MFCKGKIYRHRSCLDIDLEIVKVMFARNDDEGETAVVIGAMCMTGVAQ